MRLILHTPNPSHNISTKRKLAGSLKYLACLGLGVCDDGFINRASGLQRISY